MILHHSKFRRSSHRRAGWLLLVLLFLCLEGQSGADVRASTVTVAADEASPAIPAGQPPQLTDDQVPELIDQLAATDFGVRQRAITSLQTVSSKQVTTLVTAAENRSDAEICRRLFELLENLYISDDESRVTAASEALETAAFSDRWIVAETAGDVLDRQWRRRSKLAIQELQTLGARFNSDNLEQFAPGPGGRNAFLFQPINMAQLQINVDKSWKGGERGIQLLERLGTVVGATGPVGEVRLAIYLIDHHPLNDPEIIRLKSAFGDARVVTRGRVCLGITNNLFFGEEKGCRVGEVKENTSAHSAGIQTDDIILAVDGMEIQDFDHLVQLLRKYDVGDKVQMDVIRGDLPFRFPDAPRGINQDGPRPADDSPLRPRKMTITVELKGW